MGMDQDSDSDSSSNRMVTMLTGVEGRKIRHYSAKCDAVWDGWSNTVQLDDFSSAIALVSVSMSVHLDSIGSYLLWMMLLASTDSPVRLESVTLAS